MSDFASFNDYRALYPAVAGGPGNEQISVELAAACSQIRKHCHQTFTYVENDEITVHGTGSALLLLPELPVVAVNAVTIDKGLSSELVVTDFRCDPKTGLLFRSRSAGGCLPVRWPLGFLNITVDNDHGYEDIPPDLIHVAVHLAHERLLAGPTRLTGETITGYGYTQAAGQPAIDDYEDVLEPYRVAGLPVA